jgi:hypothetical protein
MIQARANRKHTMNKPAPKNYLLFLLLSLTIYGCSSNGQQPDWLDNPSANYPQSQYLSAIGEADKRTAAADRALANLAKIFEVAIKEDSMDFSSSKMTSTMGVTESSNEQRAARYVSTQARQVLEGATIAEYWQDQQGQFYALATLNKAKAAQRFSASIAAADRKVQQLFDYASDSAPNPVAALSALEQARTVQSERDNLNRSLSIVSSNSKPGRHSLAELESTIREALATLQFSVQADDETLQQELQNAIGTLGIQYNPQSNTVLTGSIDAEPLQNKQGWYWLRGAYQLSLSIDGTVIEKKRWPFKVSATDKGVAAQRAKDEVNSKMPTHLYELLSSSSPQ